MRENYRKSIASIKKLPQFTTMNVIDGQAGIIICSSLIFYSQTIDNILNIIVLIILAAISIMMISGNDGILSRAGNAKVTIGQATAEEEVKRAIMSLQIDGKGSNNGITPAKIAEQVNKDNGRTDVTAEGEDFPTNIVYGDGTKVYVNLDLTIGEKEEDPNAIYSENIDEEQIAPDDLFTYEPLTTGANNIKVASTEGIDSLPSKTIKITGIKSEYLYKYSTKQYQTNYKINYNKGNFDLTHLLIIPAKVEYEGEYYTVTEVDLANREKNNYGRNAGFAFPRVETIIYPNTVTKIYGIEFCSSFEEVFREDVKKVILSNRLKEIPDYFFAECASLTSVKIPESVTKIGKYAFCKCYNLKNINIPDGVESIEDEAFYYCEKLEKIIIPDSVTSIGNGAFDGCSGLQSITIPEGVTSIENNAFSGCTGLQSITIPEGVTSIGDVAFYGCTGLQSITIPENVTSIGNSAFSGCTGLQNITIPENVTSIGNSAFSGCTGLQNITIPEGVTSIGWGAYYGCTGLQNITIPNSVTSTDSSVFSGCTLLNKITINKLKGSLDYSDWELQKGTTIVWSDGEEVVN